MYTYDYRTSCLRCVVGVVSLTLSHYIYPKNVSNLSVYICTCTCICTYRTVSYKILDVMVDTIHFIFEPHNYMYLYCICHLYIT